MMASPRFITASLQRNLVLRAAVQIPRSCFKPNATWAFPRTGITRCPVKPRAFSTSLPRRFAAATEAFDPSSIDRESDQVDVCIIGGGKLIAQVVVRQSLHN